MPIIKDKNKLNPIFLPFVNRIIEVAKSNGVQLIVNETLRTNDVQFAYYLQGREGLLTVNKYRKEAGLYLLTEKENERIITNKTSVNTREGHGAGLAVDLVPSEGWSAPQSKWDIIGKAVDIVAKYSVEHLENIKMMLVWGGNWKSLKDTPHVELKYK